MFMSTADALNAITPAIVDVLQFMKLFTVLLVFSTIIARNGSKEEIESKAKENGTRLLRDNVSELVQQGVTSMDELVRVTYAV